MQSGFYLHMDAPKLDAEEVFSEEEADNPEYKIVPVWRPREVLLIIINAVKLKIQTRLGLNNPTILRTKQRTYGMREVYKLT